MEKQLIDKGIFCFIVLMLYSCSNSNLPKNGNRKFCFSNSYYRNITLKLNSDSTYLLANETTLALAFSSFGKWRYLGDNKILLKNNTIVYDSIKSHAPFKGEKIDTNKATSDRSYIFPTIRLDTIHFIDKNSLALKNYIFKKCK